MKARMSGFAFRIRGSKSGGTLLAGSILSRSGPMAVTVTPSRARVSIISVAVSMSNLDCIRAGFRGRAGRLGGFFGCRTRD